MKDLLKSNFMMVLIGSLLYLGVTFGVIVSSVSSLQGGAKPHEEACGTGGFGWSFMDLCESEIK